MKKLISIVLALMLVFSLATVAFAVDDPSTEPSTPTYSDMSTVTITKNYEATNTGTKSPAETFSFTIERTSVTDAADGVTSANMPLPTIGSVSYVAGDAGNETNKSKNITVTLPAYTSVGIYTYTIKETAGTNAGVTYYGNNIRLVVTVIQDGTNKTRVAAVHTEIPTDENANPAKSNAFSNVYSAGTLAVKKLVTGNLGDQTKPFNVTVEFTAPSGKTVNEAITYIDDGVEKTIAKSDWKNGKASAEITLKHDETVTFTNIPYDVTYTVTESDYTSDGYDTASYAFGDEAKKIDSASDTVTITNNKSVTVDTGITLDSLPFILILAVCAGAAVLFVIKRRNSVEF